MADAADDSGWSPRKDDPNFDPSTYDYSNCGIVHNPVAYDPLGYPPEAYLQTKERNEIQYGYMEAADIEIGKMSKLNDAEKVRAEAERIAANERKEKERKRRDVEAERKINADIKKHIDALTGTGHLPPAWERRLWSADHTQAILRKFSGDDATGALLLATKLLEQEPMGTISRFMLNCDAVKDLMFWSLDAFYFDVSADRTKADSVKTCKVCKLSFDDSPNVYLPSCSLQSGEHDWLEGKDYYSTWTYMPESGVDRAARVGKESNEAEAVSVDATALQKQGTSGKLRLVAIDCEMVTIKNPDGIDCLPIWRDGHRNDLTDGKTIDALVSIAVVDVLSGKRLMNTLVKPEGEVIDHKASITGITKKLLEQAEKDGKLMTRSAVLKKLEDWIDSSTIISGWGMSGDFRAMRLWHPKILDAQTLKRAFSVGRWKQAALRKVAEESGLEIQKAGENHTALEDAEATAEVIRRMTINRTLRNYYDELERTREINKDVNKWVKKDVKELSDLSKGAMLLRALYHEPGLLCVDKGDQAKFEISVRKTVCQLLNRFALAAETVNCLLCNGITLQMYSNNPALGRKMKHGIVHPSYEENRWAERRGEEFPACEVCFIGTKMWPKVAPAEVKEPRSKKRIAPPKEDEGESPSKKEKRPSRE